MQVLVSDTSVLIDLERGKLLEAMFCLPFDFAVPDLLFKRELEPLNGSKLLSQGLRVEELDGDGMGKALTYRQQEQALSLPDAFALALADINGWVLLTGDGLLRQLAHTELVTCHGVLWVLDQLYTHGSASPEELYQGLKLISRHPRCRLPKKEVERRLRAFSLDHGAA
jgi:hypothetical protein